MVTIVNTITVQALKVVPTEIQISIYNGLPAFNIVGMVNKSVNEAAIRIRAAINALGFDIPPKKIVVNLSPTNIIKDGNYYDLPIAIGILYELGIISNIDLKRFIIIGELSLDARIKKVNTTLIASIYAKSQNLNLICPFENASIASLSALDEIIAAKDLMELIIHFNKNIYDQKIQNPSPPIIKTKITYQNDFSSIKSKPDLKRALKIAAAGGHSLLIQGPPGCGKTFASEAIMSIMPDLSTKEIIEILLIQELSGKKEHIDSTNKNSFFTSEPRNYEDLEIIEIQRPFRSPHHSSSSASIIGGGRLIEPGEITFAHNGVLFLDELAEFQSDVLDSLREPLEKKEINICRAERNVTYPANFQLIAALNPCKCGYFGVNQKECNKAPSCAINYQKKISGPFLDRIDLFVYLKQTENNSFIEKDESSDEVRKIVNKSRLIQQNRFKDLEFQTNSSAKNLNNFIELCKIENDSLKFLQNLLDNNKINQRTFNKIISISRTIADIEDSLKVTIDHILEALFFKKIN